MRLIALKLQTHNYKAFDKEIKSQSKEEEKNETKQNNGKNSITEQRKNDTQRRGKEVGILKK